MNALNSRVLVLNKNWTPVDVLSVMDAIGKVFAKRALFLDTESCRVFDFEAWCLEWDDAIRTAKVAADKAISAPHFKFLLPEVIVCTEYRGFGYHVTHRRPKFSRTNIYRRDRNICFAAGTMVLMANGQQKPIEEIVKGDRVIDSSGNAQNVVNTGKRWAENVVSIKHRTSQIKTIVTKDHPFLSSTGEYKPIEQWECSGRQRGKGNYFVFPRKVNYEIEDSGIIDVSRFFPDKWFRFKNGRIYWSKRPHEPGFPAYIKISSEFSYLLGLYCAEGSFSNRNSNWAFHRKEKDTLATDIFQILSKLGLNPVIDEVGEKSINLRVGSKVLCRLLAEMCGHGAHNKRTPWSTIGKYRKEFLKGVLMGDACIIPRYAKVAFHVASYQLALDVQSIAWGMGIQSTLQKAVYRDGRKSWNTIFQGENYARIMREILGLNVETKNRRESFGNEQFVFRKLREMSSANPTMVYNIEVEGTHSYIADGMVVHNCGFCGKKFHTEDLTIDHIIPKSKGGKMTWENVTLACIPCNGRKGDRTLAEAGMRLIRKPHRPTPEDLRRNPVERILYKVGHRPPKTWEAFLGKMFWSVELKDD